MDIKKIIIALIILLVIVVGVLFLLPSQQSTTIKYDDHFKVEIPANFNTTKQGDLITSAFPANKSYVVSIGEENETNASTLEAEFKVVKDAENMSVIKDTIKDVKQYNVGSNKAYEFTTTDPSFFEENKIDAKKARTVSFLVPNSDKVYNIYFLTNDTSVNLNTPEIESIINSTSNNTTKV